jgi:hypothetical protein
VPLKRAWVRYIEGKYGTTLSGREGRLELEGLTATQSEIELIKYELVRYEAFREGEPIMAYTGRWGEPFVVDGHTRARVQWDIGEKGVHAVVFTSPDAQVDAELHRIAAEVAGGRPKRVWEMPIVDRVGKGTPAWEARRLDLLAEWRAELKAADKGSQAAE